MTKPKIHFSHANSYPSGTYRQFFDYLGRDFEIQALDMHGHNPAYPVHDGWHALVQELITELENRYDQPVILVGHSLGGILSLMAAAERPELVRCVVMLDSPVVAGWRALLWRLFKRFSFSDRFSPAAQFRQTPQCLAGPECRDAPFRQQGAVCRVGARRAAGLPGRRPETASGKACSCASAARPRRPSTAACRTISAIWSAASSRCRLVILRATARRRTARRAWTRRAPWSAAISAPCTVAICSRWSRRN
ncbi:alpha/beta fold hydrolase [Pseudoduganella sp. UC29_106]|uniref:alpha/beta fold hydrolase n=1 Tax=Pseudoduganella sp. UC29_106 TaxID=3374553 RepID=UPI003757895F